MSFPHSELPNTPGQRAHVTLLFSDLCNYTALGEVSDPEEIELFRRNLEQTAAEVVHKHRGVVSQCYGDGILAVFGLPLSEEDHCRRAVEAAIELHAAARLMRYTGESAPDFEVRMHSGVHAGLVFVRAGDSLHGAYDITGDAVSTAARLSAAAGRDEILVSASTLQGVEAFFASEPAVELALKGRRTPLRVSRVLERSAVRSRFEARLQAGLTPLAGRTEELGLLLAALHQSQAQGQRILLKGPAGIGKTRLLEEFRRRAQATGCLVMSGGCDSYGEIAPLEPFLQAWRQQFGITLSTSSGDAIRAVQGRLEELDMSDHADTMLSLLSLGYGPSQRATLGAAKASPYTAFAALLDALSERAPVALLLDDWQWADEPSRKLLARILPRLEQRGVLLLIGMRDEAPLRAHPSMNSTLDLEPLSSDEARQVIAALREKDLDIGLTTALHERSGGNPLYLEELCRSLSDDVLFSLHALEHSEIPGTLTGLIQARITKLESSPMQTLQRASIIGMEFPSALLLNESTAAQVESDLAQLVDAGLVYETSSLATYRFKHGIAREVVYGGVLIHDRRRIHHEIATALEQSVAENHLIDQSEALAFHYRGSGDRNRAALHAERAGDKAAVGSFLSSARAHYDSALESLDRQSATTEIKQAWLRICGKWAAQCAYAPTRAQLKTLERAEAYALELGDENARAHNHHMLGWFHYVFGDYTDSIRHCQLALELAQGGTDSKLLVQLFTALGQAYSVSGQYSLALQYLTNGIEQKRARASGSPSALQPGAAPSRTPAVLYAHALTCRAMIHADLGDFTEADGDIGEALRIVDGTGHAMEASVLSHHAIIQIRRGDWIGCNATSARACKVAERVNSTFVFGLCSAFTHYSRWRTEPDAEALRGLKRAVDWLEARDFGLYISFVHACLAEALCACDELDAAQAYAQRALKRAPEGDPQGEIAASRVMAAVSRQRALPWALSEEWLERSIEAAVARGSRRERALSSLCYAELQADAYAAGSDDRLRRAGLMNSAETLAALEQMGMLWYVERAQRLLLRT